eukprot:m.114820 g.114820  ORF g.114820 m.114820 type:complete len:159 (-) comp14433_c6_seq1:70-546(-)
MDESWFLGRTSSRACETILLQPGLAHGTFVVRESETRPGSYTLCVRIETDTARQIVTNLPIHSTDIGQLFIFEGQEFPGLHDLVEHYVAHGLDADGILLPLTKYTSRDSPRAPAPPLCERSSSLPALPLSPVTHHIILSSCFRLFARFSGIGSLCFGW